MRLRLAFALTATVLAVQLADGWSLWAGLLALVVFGAAVTAAHLIQEAWS